MSMTPTPESILEIRNLKKHFPITRGLLRRQVGVVKAVDGVFLSVPAGKTVGLVGESGCGKTTTGHCIMGGIPATSGEIIFHHPELGAIDLAKANSAQMAKARCAMQMVFQDPNSSLNPRMTVFDIVAEPLVVNKVARGPVLRQRVEELLHLVGLRPEYMQRFPHAFSGGQRQRIVVARALALNPRLIIADEPVSALDVSVQAQILNLLQDLQQTLGLAYLFISHDLSVVEHISDSVAVMYVGKLVEFAPTETIFHFPKHPYTQALLMSVPRPSPTAQPRAVLGGEVPSSVTPPPGCYFHPRCPFAVQQCAEIEPELIEVAPGHFVRCHLAHELKLEGVSSLDFSVSK
ncbi:oligopeptide/dipeptide ABC transporter ATP-binding protein [Caldilinea sp.]|uniref:ABC transporter ATP-binding protein n=1 Tax=Caldilinea sp. TaxID=2293560 RepID=UPI002BCBD0BE|nr:ATP-binding cassette domain-containing protein [Caldilinea sp.]